MSMFQVSRVSVEVGGLRFRSRPASSPDRRADPWSYAPETRWCSHRDRGNDRDVDFLPLTVDVEERHYAAGKIPAHSSAARRGQARRPPSPRA